MTVNYEKTGPITGEIKFSIAREEIEKALDKTFNQVKGNLSIPGFRKGRVPRKMFNQMYGEEALYEDTLNDIFPLEFAKALENVEDEIVGQPTIKEISWEKGKDWELEVEVSLKPEVKLGQYKDLEVTKQDREVTEEQVDENLENRREQFTELIIKDTPAVEGDTVVIDYEGSVDGELFEGGAATNHSLELGSNSFIPGFEEQLVGVEPDSELDVKVTFPEEYHSEDLAGAEAVFAVKVHEIKEKELPELDDEFAKDVDEEVETLEELRNKIQKELEENQEQFANDARDQEALEKAVEAAEIEEIPAEMIEEEVQRQMEMFYNNLIQNGMNPEMYFNITQTSEEDLKAQFETEAEANVRTNLVLEEIVAVEELDATEEEQEKEVATLAEQYNLPVEQVKEVLSPELLTRDIAIKKAIDLITSTAKEVLEPETAEEE